MAELVLLPQKKPTKAEDQITLIRAILKLEPCHDPVRAVEILYKEGRDVLERTLNPTLS